MAARLMTEYKQIKIDLDEVQLQKFIEMFQMKGFKTKATVYDNGDIGSIQFIFTDQGKEYSIVLQQTGATSFKFEGSYRITDWSLAQFIQKAVREFSASALVHRIYKGYKLEYSYKFGKVALIRKIVDSQVNVIYKYDDPVSELQHVFSQQIVERQINEVKQEIDDLLDERNITDTNNKTSIDTKLQKLSHKLFILEG
ncbi:hypothetical protein [Bacillus horti]|uniref:SpoU family rRNA methylase n=1 Tax=Caldalkalibacillus horti TaxID=77523 RepID=A0ABT9W4A2_9BACI|nr:hypothetical protein [Bacillus horti]MDQ0168073.1 putative SpoU family rRNA methylase [Bacillus horti]